MGQRVPAATRTLRILRVLAAGPLRVDAIAHRVNVPRSSTYQLLAAMESEGFVTQFSEGRWALGVAAAELGSAFLRTDPLEQHARSALATVISELPCDVAAVAHCAILHGRDSLYVATASTPRPTTIVADLGVRLPASLTASGRSMLATLPDAQVRALFPNRDAFVNRTGRGPMSLRALRDLLRAERRAGVFCERGYITAGFASVAVAIPGSRVIGPAALGVTMRESALGDPGALVPILDHAAAFVRTRLGGASQA